MAGADGLQDGRRRWPATCIQCLQACNCDIGHAGATPMAGADGHADGLRMATPMACRPEDGHAGADGLRMAGHVATPATPAPIVYNGLQACNCDHAGQDS